MKKMKSITIDENVDYKIKEFMKKKGIENYSNTIEDLIIFAFQAIEEIEDKKKLVEN